MEIMGALQLHPPLPLLKHSTTKSHKLSSKLNMSRGCFHKLNAMETTSSSDTTDLQEPPSIDFAFVSPKLLPDGSPDVHIRSAVGGQKLRDIMLDANIDLYGPYDKPLSNCAGGGTCGTCLVEVVEGKELLSPRTNKEKEILKRKPKTWRLACQTVVGKPDTRGEMIIQQLPEWKVHEWE